MATEDTRTQDFNVLTNDDNCMAEAQACGMEAILEPLNAES
jgi:hypothetical protein